MRIRNIKKQFWFNEEECQILKEKSLKSGLTESEYIRKIIKGYKLKEKPDERFYETMKMLRNTANNLNQLAKRANLNGFIDEVAYKKEVEKLDDFIYEIKSKFLLFEQNDNY